MFLRKFFVSRKEFDALFDTSERAVNTLTQRVAALEKRALDQEQLYLMSRAQTTPSNAQKVVDSLDSAEDSLALVDPKAPVLPSFTNEDFGIIHKAIGKTSISGQTGKDPVMPSFTDEDFAIIQKAIGKIIPPRGVCRVDIKKIPVKSRKTRKTNKERK